MAFPTGVPQGRHCLTTVLIQIPLALGSLLSLALGRRLWRAFQQLMPALQHGNLVFLDPNIPRPPGYVFFLPLTLHLQA